MKTRFVVIVVSLALAAFTFAYTSPSTSSQEKATPDTLRSLEAEFMKATQEKGSAGYLSYYADNAVELPNGYPAIAGKAEIAKTMGFLDNKDNQLMWTPVGADIAASGDLGYTFGTFIFKSKDKDGNPVMEHGKYTSIWKKQKDGSWRVVLDMGNATLNQGH